MTQTKEIVPQFNFTPATFTEAKEQAAILANSGLVPSAYKGKPDDVLVVVQFGRELGLAPLQALQSIASINGKPSLYGDALPALVQSHPAYEFMTETFEGTAYADDFTAVCSVKRKGGTVHTVRFSVADAKKANLFGKAGPWANYPKRMLQLRARAFALRDQFADALRGVGVVEEQQDLVARATPVEMPRAVGEKPPTLTEAVHAVEHEAVAAGAPAVTVEQPELAAEQHPEPAVEFISEAQRKRLFALMKDSGKTKEQVKDYLLGIGISSSTKIPVSDYELVVQFIESK